jgi:two-component system chemotaxis sensor kinase CheA
MDDLLSEFLVESGEHLETVDAELVRFERDPNNQAILGNIFRLVHTIKGTCGFLGLSRLEALAHAAESLMGKFRDGMPVTTPAVSIILLTLDRIKIILDELQRRAAEPEGSDADLIDVLEEMTLGKNTAPASEPPKASVPQVLERPLRPGEVSLDELERAFQQTPGPEPESAAPSRNSDRAVRDLPGNLQSAVGDNPETSVPAICASAILEDNAGRGGDANAAEEPAIKAQTIRVSVDTLEHLMTMVSELVLTRNQLLEIARKSAADEGYKVPLQRLSQVTAELQEGVMKTRMQPIGNAWQKLPRVIRDLSTELSKKIDLVMNGADTELDRQVLEVIKDPLTHMVRNSADHGIELPHERKLAGKPERGSIRLNAYHEGGSITIEIADDGKGLDFAAIRKKAVERAIVSDAEVQRMSESQIGKFIFHPGFSTAASVTSVSGRGVGMDVVKTNIELIGGTIEIRSEKGRGTTFTIKIPLTLAIVAALIVSSEDQRYAIPQVAVLELVRVSPGSGHAIERINGTPVVRLREKLLPIVPLSKVTGRGGTAEIDEGFVVVTQVGQQRFGILVDGVFHTEEIVVKPMSSRLRHIQLFSGNTILGDGAVVLIIDPNGLARMVGSSADDRLHNDASLAQDIAFNDDTTSLLVFRGGAASVKAVPLALVTRLEEIDASTIEQSGDRLMIQYRGRLMPIVACDDQLEIKREGLQSLVVFSDGEMSIGLAVAEIVDIVDDTLDIELVANRTDLIGSAVIRGQATEVVDVVHYLPLVAGAWMRSSAKHDVSSRSLLLVDSSSFFRDMLVPVLKASGFRVHSAANAKEALQLIGGGTPIDVMVTDLELSGHSGLELVAALRADPHHGGMPVIGLTMKKSQRQIALAHQLRIAELVTKVDRSGLLLALSELDERRDEAA